MIELVRAALKKGADVSVTEEERATLKEEIAEILKEFGPDLSGRGERPSMKVQNKPYVLAAGLTATPMRMTRYSDPTPRTAGIAIRGFSGGQVVDLFLEREQLELLRDLMNGTWEDEEEVKP